jgi:hypothetical protein
VAPVPLIHSSDRSRLHVYDVDTRDDEFWPRDTAKGPVHSQLLLNYCFGHSSSSAVLMVWLIISSKIQMLGSNGLT